MATKQHPDRSVHRALRRVLVVAVSVLLFAVLPMPPVAAQDAVAQPSESEIEQARRTGSSHSSQPELWPNLWRAARLGTLRLECPASVVEGDVIRCFVAEYSLVGKIWLTVIRLESIYRLPTPTVTATATSPSVPPDQLAGRFVTPGFSVESNKRWWVFVDTVDDDSCDPQPYSLEVSMAAMGRSASATVRVLDDGDASAPGASGAECVSPSRLEALDASASESDDSLVFTVRATGSAPQADVRVDYALVPGSAAAVSDYSDVSGTLTIPAGIGHATISVPLVDDAVAEGDESFGLVLSKPVGAMLADATATATIADDDAAAPSAPPAADVCADVVLVGSVRDVFDVTQPGFAGDHHAFVDVDVTCPGTGSPVGLPVGVSVVEGPQASLGASSHCLVRVGSRTLTVSAAAPAGCAAFAAPRTVSGADRGRSTHLVPIPDASVGQAHQMLVWVDADRDRAHDRGEPYQYVAADFVGRSVGGGTLVDFGLADDFDIELVAAGSDRIGRGGSDSELRLRLHTTTRGPRPQGEPIIVTAPLANALVGAAVSAGPSVGAEVMCLSTSGTASLCRTDADGQIIVRYRVGSAAVSVLRRAQDVLAVFSDPDQDGRRALGAPTSFLTRPIAKTVNYVALGDSYSSGEAGDNPPPGTAYQTNVSDADKHCRRWSEAYPSVFVRDVLGGDALGVEVTFATFACTGAITRNVFDARDPLGDSDDLVHHRTNRPSSRADVNEYVVPAPTDVHGNPLDTPTVVYPPTDFWEPRQAASLAGVQAMANVDMITITIGGNDAGFGDVLKACVLGALDCDRGDLPDDYGEIPARLTALFAELKRTTPNASIFVLGYPYITPRPTEASRQRIEVCGLHGQPLQASSINSGAIPALFHFLRFGNVADTAISFDEAAFLWTIATELNHTLKEAATAAGVHFVDVNGPQSAVGFAGHSPCSSEPWLHGFVAYGGLRRHVDMPVADDSFHPNEAGHRVYAQLLESYIESQIDAGTALSESGIPVNPRRSE